MNENSRSIKKNLFFAHMLSIVWAATAFAWWRLRFNHDDNFNAIALLANGIEFMIVRAKSSENEKFIMETLLPHTDKVIWFVPWIR